VLLLLLPVHHLQAWGVLERQAGNAPLARELFKAALKVGTCVGVCSV
jgi:hypothetical protein